MPPHPSLPHTPEHKKVAGALTVCVAVGSRMGSWYLKMYVPGILCNLNKANQPSPSFFSISFILPALYKPALPCGVIEPNESRSPKVAPAPSGCMGPGGRRIAGSWGVPRTTLPLLSPLHSLPATLYPSISLSGSWPSPEAIFTPRCAPRPD